MKENEDDMRLRLSGAVSRSIRGIGTLRKLALRSSLVCALAALGVALTPPARAGAPALGPRELGAGMAVSGREKADPVLQIGRVVVGTVPCTQAGSVPCDDGNPCTDDACDTVSGECQFVPDESNTCDDGNACTQVDICQHGECVGVKPVACGLTPVEYGFPENAGGYDTARPYWFGGFQLRVTEPITLTAFGLVSLSDFGNAAMALYSDWDGRPDQLVAYTRTAPLTEGRVDIPIVTPVPIQPGLYWIMAMYDGSSRIGFVEVGRLNYWTHDFTFGSPPSQRFIVGTSSYSYYNNYYLKGTTGSLAVCHVPGVCSPATGLCDDPVAPDGTPCGDADPCTRADTCSAGQCVGGPPLNCDDGNICTDDACVPMQGCRHTFNQAPCDDGSTCTIEDSCSYGHCRGFSRPCPAALVEADTKVKSSAPDTSYAASTTLEADKGPNSQAWTLLRLRVSGLGEDHISKAVLTLVPTVSSTAGGRVRAVSCDWDPATVTWSTKPVPGSVVRSSIGPLTAGKPVKVNVTGAFGDAGGTACVVIDNPQADATYNSLEARSWRPVLAIETTCRCDPLAGQGKADATVLSTQPTTNFGVAQTLRASADPAEAFFVRLRVSGVGTRSIKSARLRLHVADLDGAESDRGGRIRQLAASECPEWKEHSITWANQPTSLGPALSSLGPVARGGIAEFDLKSTITGDGTYCYRVEGTSADEAIYQSVSVHNVSTSRPVVVIVLAP